MKNICERLLLIMAIRLILFFFFFLRNLLYWVKRINYSESLLFWVKQQPQYKYDNSAILKVLVIIINTLLTVDSKFSIKTNKQQQELKYTSEIYSYSIFRVVLKNQSSFCGVASHTNCQWLKAVKADWVQNAPVIFIDTQYRCKKSFLFL